MTDNAGLYLHIPFCKKKCRYCDFYSSFVTDSLLDSYTEALILSIKKWGGKFDRPIDTIYLGGGTPSLLERRIPKLLNSVRSSFNITDSPEITLELNPDSDIRSVLLYAAEAGVNRLSIGMQSGINEELEILGRAHSAEDTVNTVRLARGMGFSNISLDIMIGLPFSDNSSLKRTLTLLTSLSPEHISAYILKTEPRTVFFKEREKLCIPDDDSVAEQYLLMCEFLENAGYSHYEISNFCKEGFHSRHNIKYWKGNEYLGIGPAAHSFVNGNRFYYPHDLKGFINGNTPLPDGKGGTESEYIMLSLRLKEGISLAEYKNRFSCDLPYSFSENCRTLSKAGYINITEDRISLTDNGMLLSNTVISELLQYIE